MSDPTEFARRLKTAVDGRSVRSLADRSGWGRTTVHEWLTGSRLPNPQQLDDLMDAVEAAESVRGELAARLEFERDAGHVQPDAEPARSVPAKREGSAAEAGEEDSPQPAAGSGQWRDGYLRRPTAGLLVAVLAVIAAAAFGGGYAVGRLGRSASSAQEQGAGAEPKGTGAEPKDAARSVGSAGVAVRVAHTQDKGVFTFVGPSSETEHVSSLAEGQRVVVVCLALHGQRKDDKALDQHRTVWALLSSGGWVPDLYLNTEKNWQPPQDPPEPFKVC